MKVVFRVDASLQIGTGHVMRCLTLADALAARSVECLFICRAHEGNLIDFIRDKGYATHALQVGAAAPKKMGPGLVRIHEDFVLDDIDARDGLLDDGLEGQVQIVIRNRWGGLGVHGVDVAG